MPRFFFRLASGDLQQMDLGPGVHVVGRLRECRVCLQDPSLSRRHAQILINGAEEVSVEDLGSTNGTHVGGIPVLGRVELASGQVVHFGEVLAYWQEPTSHGLVIDPAGRQGQVTVVARRADLLRSTGGAGGESVGHFWAGSIELIQDMTLALVNDAPLEELLDQLLERLHVRLKATRSAVLLQGTRHGLEMSAYRGPENAPLRISQTLLSTVLDHREGLLVKDLNLDSDLRDAASLRQQEVSSILATPLEHDGEVVGLLYFEAAGQGRHFRETDLRLVSILAHLAAARIRLRRLQDQALEKRLLDRDLQIAREVQQRLLPEHLPDLPGFQLWGENRAYRGVSSQVYGAWTSPYGRVFLAVAEVNDLGLGAGLLMAFLQAHLAAWGQIEVPAALLAGRLSRVLQPHLSPHQAVRGAFVYLDPEEGALTACVAGESAAGILGASRPLPSTGPAIRFGEASEFRESVHLLQAGEVLCLGTPGLLLRHASRGGSPWEAMPRGEGWELSELAEALLDHSLDSAETLSREDCTLLLCRRLA